MASAWVVILAAGAVTQALRVAPVLLVRWRGEHLPPLLTRALEYAGFATVGGLIAAAVFRPGGSPALPEVALKVGALALSFLLFLRFGRGLACLAAAYGVYVVLVLLS
jgi:branched-subunit amino acid transport protein